MTGCCRLAVRIAAVLAAGALAGCGGSSSSPAHTATATASTTTSKTATSAAMTREQFAVKLDDICKRSGAAAKTAASDLKAAHQAHNDAEIASALERLLSVTAPSRAEMAKLTPPADLEGAFGRYTSATERLQGITLSTIAALKAHHTTALKTLAGLETSATDTRTKAAIDLGAKNCEARKG